MIIQEAERLNHVKEYYFSSKLKELRRLNQQGMNIINLGIGSPDLPPSNQVIDELYEQSKLHGNHGYQSYTGIPELRGAIANYLRQHYQINFQSESEILPLIGSKEGIMHISMAFLNPGDKVLVPNPGYPTYSSVSRLVSAEIIEYNLDTEDWHIDFEALEALPLDDIKLMWVNYPNMPTGVKGTVDQFSRLISLAEKHKFLIINDNPYSQLYEGELLSIFQTEGSREVCLELNSLSKSHNMAGWRIGWISGDAQYIQSILKVKSNMDSGMFKPLQLAAAKALESSEDWFEQLNNIYRQRRKLAFQIFDLLNCHYEPNQGGMFVWGRVPKDINDVEQWVDEIMHQAQVFITPGFIFGSAGERNLRISLCSSAETLQEAYQRVEKIIK